MNIDKEIMDILSNDASLNNQQIAAMLGVETETVEQSRKQLEDLGIIMKYIAVINTEKLNEDKVEAMIELKVTPQRELGYNDIAKRVYKFPEVKAVYLVSGSYDLSVKVEAPTMKDVSKFVWEKLAVLDGVSSTVTLFIMRKYKDNGLIMIEEEEDGRLVITP